MLLIKRYDPLVKWLRHGPFTAVTWVQIPYGSLPQFNFLALSNGGLPKWLKGTVLKTVRRLCRAWVQIPHPPLIGPLEQWFSSPPCHGGGREFESLLGRLWGLSSAGRASALQAEGHRFEPYRSHFVRNYEHMAG